jgi:hypothetical protein
MASIEKYDDLVMGSAIAGNYRFSPATYRDSLCGRLSGRGRSFASGRRFKMCESMTCGIPMRATWSRR